MLQTPPPANAGGSERRDSSAAPARLSGLGTGFVILSLILLVAVPYWTDRQVETKRAEIEELIEPVRRGLVDLEVAIAREVSATRGFVLTGDSVFVGRYRAAQAAETRAYEQLTPRVTRLGSETADLLAGTQDLLIEWRERPERFVRGELTEAEFLQALPDQQALYESILEEIFEIHAAVAREAGERREGIRSTVRLELTLTGILVVIAFLSAVVVGWMGRRQRVLTEEVTADRDIAERRAHAEAVLGGLMREVSAVTNLGELLRLVIESALEHTGASGSYLEMTEVHGGRDEVEVMAAGGQGVPPVGTRVPYPGSLTETIIESGEPELLTEIGAIGETMAPYLRDRCHQCTGLVLPLVSEGRLLGALVLLRPSGRAPFRREEAAFARALSDVASSAIRRVLLLQQVQEGDRRFREFAENVRAVFWIADPHLTRFLYVSPAFEEIWGRPVQAVYDDPGAWAKAVHPADRNRPREAVRRLEQGEAVNLEYRIIRPDGEIRWVRVRGFPVREDDGEPERIVGVTEDITERREREEALRFLADAGRVLGASLEFEDTLQDIAHYATTTMADWCVVDVVEGDTIRRVAVGHADPSKEEFARSYLQRFPPDPSARSGVAEVIRTGTPEVLSEIPRAALREVALNEEHLAVLQQLGMKSAMIVPMVSRGRTLGAVTLIAAESGRRYDNINATLVEELAGRAALAIDNARLYSEAEGARESMAAILESITDAFFALDRDWRFTYVNRKAEEILQRPRDDLIGKSIWSSFPEAVGSPFEQEYAKALEQQVTREFEAHYPPLNVWFEVRAYPSTDGLSVYFRDVTERREAEAERVRLLEMEMQAREEAERRAREETALRHATAAVSASFTKQEVIQQIASSALEATGADGAFVKQLDRRREEVVVVAVAGEGAPPLGVRSPYDGSLTEHVVQREEPVVVESVTGAAQSIARNLEEMCGECSALIVPLLDGSSPIGSLVLVRGSARPGFHPDEIDRASIFADLAGLAFRKVHLMEEAERRREELERLTESRARLMRGFSHDVKNPLGAADGYAELLEEGIFDELSPKQRESVGRMRRSIRSALGLIDDLLDLARAEAGQIEIRMAPTDVRDAVREMAEEYRAQAEARKLSLEVRVPENVPLIESDSDRLRQILGNLLSNAVKYTRNGGITVEVEVRDAGPELAPGRWIAAVIRDTGPGIPAAEQHRLFEEFVRLDGSGERGAGIGLAISRRIARALGGEVTMQSEVGEGSTFTVWLPLDVPDHTTDESSWALEEAGRTGDR